MTADATRPPPQKRTRLRDAQKEFTRSKIRDAARVLFYERGLEMTTVDQIAEQGGFQRSTVYRYYRDKGEILDDIIADYAPRVQACMETLPANPTSQRTIQRWMEDVTAFNQAERMSLIIIEQVVHRGKSAAAVQRVSDAILTGLGRGSPAFLRAASPNAPLALRAEAIFLVQQLTFSCELYLNQADPKWARAVRNLTAANLFAFMTKKADAD